MLTVSVVVGRRASGRVFDDVQLLGRDIVAHFFVERLEECGERLIRDVFHPLLHVV